MLNSLEIPKIKLSGLRSGKTDVPAVKKGSVSVSARLRHMSVLLFAVPVEAVRRLIPADFEPAETLIDGKRVAWLSVASFLDEGSRLDGQGAFEQTDYRLHVIRDGRPAQWLIGTSLGSLAAVGMRNLWPMPWRLSAMEFQVSYDSYRGRYANYHLHTQSQWENAVWEISDSGEAFLDAESDIFPASLFAETVTTYFERRDGSTGSIRTRNSGLAFTKAVLKKGQSEMLVRLGMLSKQEAGNPVLALTQHSMTCQHYSPIIIGSPARPSTESPGRLLEYARAS